MIALLAFLAILITAGAWLLARSIAKDDYEPIEHYTREETE